MKRVAVAIGCILLLVLGVALARALTLPSRQLAVEPAATAPVDMARLTTALREGIALPTIAAADGTEEHREAFSAFADLLVARYPRVHATLEREALPSSTPGPVAIQAPPPGCWRPTSTS